MVDVPHLLKMCNTCGERKPLAAFLQLAGSSGTTYGNTCATCRSINAHKEDTPKDSHESTSSTIGYKIDAKAKLHSEIDKKQQHQHTEELYREEKEKAEHKKVKIRQKIRKHESEQRKHRQTYLDKSSFIKEQTKTDRERLTQTKIQSEARIKGEATKHEEKLKTIDLTAPYQPSQTGAQLKHQGAIFNQFKSWLGGAAPISRQGSKLASNQQKKETLTKIVDETWRNEPTKPGSKKR